MRKQLSKTKWRILTLVTLLAMLIVAVIPVATLAAESQLQTTADSGSSVVTTPGKSENWRYFKEDTAYDMTTKVSPMTFEFELAGTTHIAGAAYGGVIVGNYSENASTYINVEAVDYGKIIVRGKYNGGSEWKATFYQSEADIRVGGIHHYTVTVASGWTGVSLYVDGVHKATRYPASLTIPKATEYTHPFRIGGDHSSTNTGYFKGLIYSVAMFNDVRTAAEIAEDKNINKTWSSATSGLVAAYDMTKMGEAALRDYSGNGNTLTYTNGSGIQVENFGKYEIDKSIEANIETFEAWIFMPDYYHGKIGGTIIGNYRSYNGARVILEIYIDGNPRLSYTNAEGKTSYHRFTDVDLRTGTWQHLAVVHDVESGEARCYVNGELKQTVTENVVAYADNALDQKFLIGRDTALRYAEGDGEYWENRKDQYFKGFIKELRLYSDVRSAEEIAADYAGNLDKSELIAAYEIDPDDAYTNLADLSGNGYDANYKQLLWEAEYVEPINNNYSYSLALVGDTQTVANQNPELLKNIYQWILDNQTSKNIQYVIGLGDITEYGVDVGHKNYEEARANAQWTAAKEAISLMDGKIPYSLIRGDGHDGIELFNQYFANHEGYTSNITGYYEEGRIDNVYHTFKAGSVDYLLLCLDHGTKDDVLVWANEVIASHPNHRVIVTTHQYLESNGTLSERGETGNATAYDPNNNAADDLWNKLLSKHPNIAMIICGHSDSDDVVVTKQIGNHGNEVTQVLVNPQSMDAEYAQGSKGMVAMLYFSEDGNEVQVQYYSTLKDTYRPASNFTVSTGSHKYEASVTEPTCTEGGYTTHTCFGCNDSYVTDKVPAKGHTEEVVSAVAPTCTATGLTEGKRCTACGVITVEQSSVPAKGHTEKTLSAVAPTCTATGLTEGKECTVCGVTTVEQKVVPENGHNYKTEVIEPTCTKAGYTTYTCTVCGDSYVSDNTEALGHNYGASVTAPTCEKDGYTTYTCTLCNDTYTSDATSAIGHDYVGAQTLAPTCVANGLKTYTCKNDASHTYTEDVAPLGHSYTSEVTAPDCENEGYTTYTCTVCNHSYTDDRVAALGHTAETVSGKAPTCTETGLTDGSKCSVCGDTLLAQNVIPANGHVDLDPKDYVCDVCEADLCIDHNEEIIPGKAPTCTETGLTDGKKCSICGDVLLSQESIPALGHSYKSVVTAPDCVKGGYTTYTCTVCGDSYVADNTAALGHSYKSVVTDPDCVNGGYTTYTCSVCDDSYVADETEALGHSYDAVVTDPDCVNGGYTTYTCSVCDDSYVADETEALDHSWTPATTESPETCEKCGETRGEKLPESQPEDVEDDHSECAPKNELEEIIYMIINFFRSLFGLPEQCYCGKELN